MIGGLISGISTLLGQRVQAKSVLVAQDKSQREELYRDFIVTASKIYADGMMHDQPQVPDVVAIYALVNRMRIISSARVIVCAERTAHTVTEAYFMPNKTVQELHEMIKSETIIDPLKEFGEAARDELRTIRLV